MHDLDEDEDEEHLVEEARRGGDDAAVAADEVHDGRDQDPERQDQQRTTDKHRDDILDLLEDAHRARLRDSPTVLAARRAVRRQLHVPPPISAVVHVARTPSRGTAACAAEASRRTSRRPGPPATPPCCDRAMGFRRDHRGGGAGRRARRLDPRGGTHPVSRPASGPEGDVGVPPPALHHAEQVMGTVVTLDLYGALPAPGRDAFLALARARALLHRVDALFSTYKANSPISAIRRGELRVEDAPAEVGAALTRCAQLRELTDGLFDPWAVPGGVDPSGYVKGLAAAQALAIVAPAAGSGALVNAAGDIAVAGSPGPGLTWRVGILDPASRRHLLAVAEVGAAIATSGTYERGAHIVDPRSGTTRTAAASASVVGPDAGDCDALATALCVGGKSALALLGRLPGYEGLVVGNDGATQHTEAFPFAPMLD